MTKAVFLRYQKQFSSQPKFAAEERLRKVLKRLYGKVIKNMLSEFKKHAQLAGMYPERIVLDNAEDETLERLMDFFDHIAKEEETAKKLSEHISLKAQLSSAVESFEGAPTQQEYDDDLVKSLLDVFWEDQKYLIKKLGSNSDEFIQRISTSFSIDKKKLYSDNLEELRRLYLDNSIKRIAGEKDLLKKRFLKEITDYVLGDKDVIDLKDVTKSMLSSSARMARFFARDQLSRLNRSTTVATFRNAGVTKVKWLTSHDVRVRSTHKALDGQVFDINNLPEEFDDYNCRCGLIPVEFSE